MFYERVFVDRHRAIGKDTNSDCPSPNCATNQSQFMTQFDSSNVSIVDMGFWSDLEWIVTSRFETCVTDFTGVVKPVT